jgi:L-cysteine:1D-myo-inositol 2-amino-2-deoxy-alpha-D-glucopyranoside ligase
VTHATPHLYNTETRRIEPVTEDDIGLYVCGVTPYDTSHLGHAFTYTVFDVLIRYLRFLGRRVTYVQNVTDIDDDVLLRAQKNGDDWKALGDREYAAFRAQMAALGNLDPDVAPRATDHIPEMLDIIERLIKNGLAYIASPSPSVGAQHPTSTDEPSTSSTSAQTHGTLARSSAAPSGGEGSVYFDVRKDPDFGRLFREPYEAMLHIANERGNFPADPLKRDPLDFVLWQAQKPGEPAWDSPWGPGRPGWHIECSAMAMKYLGPSITIHGGGEDLVFPHHAAETAQSEHATGVRPFVLHWMHAAMVYCGEHKMSKSLGNMVFVADLLERCTADALRLHLLSHHYRKPWDHPIGADLPTCDLAQTLAARLGGLEDATPEDVERHGAPILEALADDFETPRAIDELTRLAESTDPTERRVARALGRKILGLSFTPS